MVELYIDTANLEEIKEVLQYGVISGCTTNPKIVAKEKGCNFEQRMKDILGLMKDMPVSIEVTTNDCREMVKEAEGYHTWGNNVVVKIPMGLDGLKAAKQLYGKGIKTNITACMTVNQAVMAALTGTPYLSLFYGRIKDISGDPVKTIKETKKILNEGGLETKVIIGSIRGVMDVQESIIAGADIVTVTCQIFKDMAYHPQTEKTINEFLDFWEEFKKGKKS